MRVTLPSQIPCLCKLTWPIKPDSDKNLILNRLLCLDSPLTDTSVESTDDITSVVESTDDITSVESTDDITRVESSDAGLYSASISLAFAPKNRYVRT